jgi:hypothetical protein
MSGNQSQQLGQKLWNYCNLLRDFVACYHAENRHGRSESGLEETSS